MASGEREPLRARRGVVVVVDDDEDLLLTIARILQIHHFEVLPFLSAQEALETLEQRRDEVDVVLSDLRMPEMDGLTLMAAVHERAPGVPVLVMTAHATVESAVEAMRRGAYHYLQKPLPHPEEVALTVARAVDHRRLLSRTRQLEQRLVLSERFSGIVGVTPAMREVYQLVETVAGTDATVLVLGESGTGKELVARAIHERSPRRIRAFIAVNCSALSESLLESELFGHVKGAFTGAIAARRGLFEEASGGTLFLDEIGDVSLALQVRLLRALQEGEVKPVGASEARKVDARVIAATHRDLHAAMGAGTFRQDLYYRLNVLSIELPPLRRRPDDIPLLVQHFIQKYAARHGRAVNRVEDAALERLLAYAWPGNVRELENVVQRAVLLAQGEAITAELLPRPLRGELPPMEVAASDEALFTEARAQALASFERRYLERVLAAEQGNLARAARRAGLDKSNFRRMVRRHEVDLGRFRGGSGSGGPGSGGPG
ncbi:MAG: sigma-54-dependent Fis family transcriptional regulator [Deltaproteobacteria bacterium]|nr:sigma-54-dependent Fis family transcriptional regulator [Deltaproteobacteria bacterium]